MKRTQYSEWFVRPVDVADPMAKSENKKTGRGQGGLVTRPVGEDVAVTETAVFDERPSLTDAAAVPMLFAQTTTVATGVVDVGGGSFGAAGAEATTAATSSGFLGLSATTWGVIGGGVLIAGAAGGGKSESAGATPPSKDTEAPLAVANLRIHKTATSLDTGILDSDGNTSDQQIEIRGTIETGASYQIFDDADNDGQIDAGELITKDSGFTSNTLFSATVTLAEGSHNLRAFQTDAAGNQSGVSAALTVTIDKTVVAPVLDLAAADDKGKFNDDNLTSQKSALTFTGTCEQGASVILDQLDSQGRYIKTLRSDISAPGTSFSFDVDFAQSGEYILAAKQVDLAGNQSSYSTPLGVTVKDTVSSYSAPYVYTISPNVDYVKTTNLSTGLKLEAWGEVGSTVRFFEDTNGDGHEDIYLGTAEVIAGVHQKTLTVSNPFGGAPIVIVHDLAVLPVTLSTGVHHIGTAFTSLSGAYVLAATTAITMDTTAPAAPGAMTLAAADDSAVTTDAVTKNTTALTLSGTGENGAVVTVFDDVNNNGVFDSGELIATPTVANGSFSLDVALNDGVHRMRSFQTDLAGNKSPVSFPLTMTVDTAAPTISASLSAQSDNVDLDAASSTDQQDRLTADTTPEIAYQVEAGSIVEVSWNGGTSYTAIAGQSTGGLQYYSAATALSNGTHTVVVRATDLAGNVATNTFDISTMSGTDLPYVDGLVAGMRYGTSTTGTTIKYAVNETPQSLGNGTVGYAWTPEQKAALSSALATWSNVAAVSFQSTTDLNAADFIFNLGDLAYFGSSSALGRMSPLDPTDLPNDPYDTQSGVAIFNKDATSFASLAAGSDGFNTLVHEIGHGLGLAHPHEDNGISSVYAGVASSSDLGTDKLNTTLATTMSYQAALGSNTYSFGEVAGPMALDIEAIQHIYGSNSTYHGGADTYSLDTVEGTGADYSCIWDTGGTDQIVYTGSENCVIDLRDATLSGASAGGYVSGVYTPPSNIGLTTGDYYSLATQSNPLAVKVHTGFTIANGVVVENAVSGAGSDLLTGNAAANSLRGKSGADRLTGNAGADTFVLELTGGGSLVGQADTITDYLDGTDRIGLANGLTFGQLTISQSGADTVIRATASSEYLAVLLNVAATNILASDFVAA